MEIKFTTKMILKILYILSWILFLGLSVDAGSYLFSAFYTHFFNHHNADYFGLSALYRFDRGYFIAEIILITIPAALKAVMFYLVVKILLEKKLDMARPFNEALQRLTFLISILAVSIGLFTMCAASYTEWLVSLKAFIPNLPSLHLEGGDVWIFMSIVMFVIGQIFKRGMEIQAENDLTI